MRKSGSLAVLASVFLACGTGWAQGHAVKRPQIVDDSFLASVGARLSYSRTNKLSAAGNAATKQQRVESVPSSMRSFTFQGQTFPYTMVGQDPARGGTAHVDVSMIAISFFFDEFVDQSGNNIVIESAPIMPLVKKSPNFENAAYGTGFTQFSDAIQRAEFFSVAKDHWHTLLEPPKMLEPVQIEVPVGQSVVLQTSATGTIFALINSEFFVSQLNTIVQLEEARVDELEFALTRNGLLYNGPDPFAPGACCTIGFHTAFEAGMKGDKRSVQTFAFATWLDSGIFPDTSIADVNALSHEITEWMNDPFVNNIVPAWQRPDGSGNCGGSVLETGDPVDVLPNDSFPVMIDGFLYHPQTEALLQWFERKVPSDAFQHAYSYPDTSKLTSPSVACQ
jgi:chitinase